WKNRSSRPQRKSRNEPKICRRAPSEAKNKATIVAVRQNDRDLWKSGLIHTRRPAKAKAKPGSVREARHPDEQNRKITANHPSHAAIALGSRLGSGPQLIGAPLLPYSRGACDESLETGAGAGDRFRQFARVAVVAGDGSYRAMNFNAGSNE